MNIDTLSKNKIKISLTDEEIYTLFGGYDMIDYSKPRSKTVIDMLISRALPEEMLPLDCNKVLIEVRPIYGGCAIYFTRIYDKKKQKSNKAGRYILFFETSEKMITALPFISASKSRLYHINNGLALLIEAKEDFDKIRIGEYADCIIKDKIMIEKITEHSKIICKSGAVSKLKKAFIK